MEIRAETFTAYFIQCIRLSEKTNTKNHQFAETNPKNLS